MKRQAQKVIIACISVALLLIYIASLSLIETSRSSRNGVARDIGLWNLPPVVLTLLSGEFRGIVADLLILEAGARVGTKIERTSEGEIITISSDYNKQTIYEILVASQSLDPTFQQIYMLAQGWLPWDGLVEETIGILDTVQDNRHWNFFPTQFMAFDTYYFLNDYVRAGEILLKAASKENAPSYLGILGSRLSHKGGDTRAAITLMQTVMLGKNPEDLGYQELQDRLKALKGSLIIEQAVLKYQQYFSTLPEQPEQLLKNEILQHLPDNPYKLPYCINQQGKVFFDRPYCRENPHILGSEYQEKVNKNKPPLLRQHYPYTGETGF